MFPDVPPQVTAVLRLVARHTRPSRATRLMIQLSFMKQIMIERQDYTFLTAV